MSLVHNRSLRMSNNYFRFLQSFAGIVLLLSNFLIVCVVVCFLKILIDLRACSVRVHVCRRGCIGRWFVSWHEVVLLVLKLTSICLIMQIRHLIREWSQCPVGLLEYYLLDDSLVYFAENYSSAWWW